MGGGYYRAATVPPPRPWCKAVAESADVRALMRVDVKQQFSAAGKKLIVEGLEEVVIEELQALFRTPYEEHSDALSRKYFRRTPAWWVPNC